MSKPANQQISLRKKDSGNAAKSYMPSEKDKREAAARNKVAEILERRMHEKLFGQAN